MTGSGAAEGDGADVMTGTTVVLAAGAGLVVVG